ncbi:unnamed protein product [Amaranthus hypochondriacus]
MTKEFLPLGITILDINTPLTVPYTLKVPSSPLRFTKFLVNSFIDDNHDEQLMQVFFNGGNVRNVILDDDPNFSPITLSCEFLYYIPDYLLIGHSTPLTNQNADSIIDTENPPPNFNNWSHFFRTINPNSASFTITPYIADQLNHTYDLDTFIFFRCVESTQPENQTQQREIHIKIIQQNNVYLNPDTRNWVTDNWNFLGTEPFVYVCHPKRKIILSYKFDVSKFLASMQNRRMKNFLDKGLPIRVSNVYLNKLDRSGVKWALLHGLQMKLVKERNEEKLCLWASKIQELHRFFNREGLMQLETYYRWRNRYLELQIFFGLY